jgi:hypothetical protein
MFSFHNNVLMCTARSCCVDLAKCFVFDYPLRNKIYRYAKEPRFFAAKILLISGICVWYLCLVSMSGIQCKTNTDPDLGLQEIGTS